MVIVTSVSGETTNLRAVVSISSNVATVTKDSFPTVKRTDMENIFTITEIYMKEIGKMILNMEKGTIPT